MLDVYPNLAYSKRNWNSLTCFQILKKQNHKLQIEWIYIIKSNETSINDKVQSSYIEFTLKSIKQKVFGEHDVQSNKIKHNINIKKMKKNGIYNFKNPWCSHLLVVIQSYVL